MRPTRFTRQERRTKFGQGGWGFSFPDMIHYTHPVTGDGYSVDRFGLRWLLHCRKIQEARRAAKPQEVKGVTWEP